MSKHVIRTGLQLPITGRPTLELDTPTPARHVALHAADYPGLKPSLRVSVGDTVVRGQLLFEDKSVSGVRYTSPAAGTIHAIHRGARRALQSVVIEQSRAEREDREPESVTFGAYSGRHPSGMTGDEVRALLLESGQWTALRGRPYGRVADPAVRPHSIFVTAMDTNPLAPSSAAIADGQGTSFDCGLAALSLLTEGPVFVCSGSAFPLHVPTSERIKHEVFEGVHPAGTVGLHIHTLDAVNRDKVVWHIGLQDVLSTGRLFETGQLDVRRVVSLGGPPVLNPRLIQTRIGAAVASLTDGAVDEVEDTRMISGSVLSGRQAEGDVHGYLGRYHQQISVLKEGRSREFLGWLGPGWNKFSTVRTFVSSWLSRGNFAMTTSTNGSPRAIVPIGMYERVMPMDLLATPLLRALVMEDVERAEELGCLELDEEDLALCTFVDPGKTDFAPYLRRVLDILEKEG